MTRRASRGLAALALLASVAGRPVAAQTASANGAAAGAIPSLGLLPDRPHATMAMKLEKTIFAVDVLTLRLRVDPGTAADLDTLVAAEPRYDRDRAAAIAGRAVEASEAVATIEFLRDVGLDRFLDGVDEDMRKALEAGWLEPEGYRKVRDGLPRWFAFLAERGIRDGDRLAYHVVGDSLRTVFADASGEVMLDQTDVGRQHVLALLGAWFAPGSSFREKLIRSLWQVGSPG